MAAKAIRKMHVPAYCPAEFGVQAFEKSDVVVEEKNVMVIMLIGIALLEPISIGPDVALAVAMGMDIDMPAMSLVTVAIDIESIVKRRYGVVG